MLSMKSVFGHLLIGGVLTAGAIAPLPALIVRGAVCSQEILLVLGECPQSDGDSVTIAGSQSQLESSIDPPGVPESFTGDTPGELEPSSPQQPPMSVSMTCRDDIHEDQSCLGGIRVDAPTTETPAPTTPGTPAWRVTITDLARFVPSTATVGGEPGNVAVVGLPANFLSSAKTETIPGTVLGRALSIRFTPVNYAFDYGDGERRDSAGPGTAWDASGQAQFTPTTTSHVYKEPGRYTATVTVTYTADVDLGSGWIPIRGTLNGPPAGQEIRVVKAHTALVLGICHERPSAPGC